MTSPPPTTTPTATAATAKQLKLLRHLSPTSGHTFTWPRTKREATAEINRLLAVHQNTPIEQLLADRTTEPERLQDTTSPYRATEVREDKITGYGANCQWSHSVRGPNGRASSSAA